MALPRVIFEGVDLYELGYVDTLPAIQERKGFGRGKLTPSNFSLNCRNNDDFFSVDNPSSFLNGTDWLYASLKVYNADNILTFDGIVQDVKRDHKKKRAIIECRDTIFQNRKTPIEYESSAWETPAKALENIFVQEGYVNYNASSLIDADDVLTANNCYCKVRIREADNLTIFTAAQKLGHYGCADVYMHLNDLYYQHWTPFNGGVSVSFNYGSRASAPKTLPTISNAEEELVNDYLIGYENDNGFPVTDSSSGNIAESSRLRYGTQRRHDMRSDNKKQIIFKDSTSAQYIGETYIKRSHKSLTTPRALVKIDFDVDLQYREFVELGYFFKMTFDGEGWREKIFEVFEFKRDEDKRNINIVAYEVIE